MGFKYFNFRCTKCDVTYEALVGENEAGVCPKCGDTEHVERAPNAVGGYNGDTGSASVRPRGAGSWRRT